MMKLRVDYFLIHDCCSLQISEVLWYGPHWPKVSRGCESFSSLCRSINKEVHIFGKLDLCNLLNRKTFGLERQLLSYLDLLGNSAPPEVRLKTSGYIFRAGK